MWKAAVLTATALAKARMPVTLPKTGPITLSSIALEFEVVFLFSFIGLALSAAILSHISSETVSTIFSSIE